MRWFALAAIASACSSSSNSERAPSPAPEPAPAPAEPAPPDPPDPPDPPELDVKTDPFEADLDGDGKPEPIAFECGERSLSVSVGAARASVTIGLSEVVGCSAAVVPSKAGALLLVTADEHEEAGTDFHAFYSYRAGALARVWSGVGDIEVTATGWQTSDSDCDDTAGKITTTTKRMRWNGTAVETKTSTDTTDVAPADCAEP